jgi:hypothetical protein
VPAIAYRAVARFSGFTLVLYTYESATAGLAKLVRLREGSIDVRDAMTVGAGAARDGPPIRITGFRRPLQAGRFAAPKPRAGRAAGGTAPGGDGAALRPAGGELGVGGGSQGPTRLDRGGRGRRARRPARILPRLTAARPRP